MECCNRPFHNLLIVQALIVIPKTINLYNYLILSNSHIRHNSAS